jgi:drug/metabolite transporter (DMT)-like permease
LAKISYLGIQSAYYFNSGGLVFCIAYFVYKREWARKNVGPKPLPGQEMDRFKVLFRKWESNEIDWPAILVVFVNALTEAIIAFGVIYNFKLSVDSGLNVGISTAIWSVTPFFMAIIEWLFF